MIQFLRGKSTASGLSDVVLQAGQPFSELDTHQLKVGDGVTKYSELPYVGGSLSAQEKLTLKTNELVVEGIVDNPKITLYDTDEVASTSFYYDMNFDQVVFEENTGMRPILNSTIPVYLPHIMFAGSSSKEVDEATIQAYNSAFFNSSGIMGTPVLHFTVSGNQIIGMQLFGYSNGHPMNAKVTF